jgi:hypothetical protein
VVGGVDFTDCSGGAPLVEPMVPSKKNIRGWEEHTGFGGGRGGGGLTTWALIFFGTLYVNSTFRHPLGKRSNETG